MSGPIALPATPEAFVEYQERLISRKLSAAEKEATAVWLGIFNDVCTGDLDGAVAVERIDCLIVRNENPRLLWFLLAAREWIIYAWKGVDQ